jgi:hypothetical protein
VWQQYLPPVINGDKMMMNDVVLTALAAALGKMAKASGHLAAGIYMVDETITLRVKGDVKKSQDEEYVPTIAMPVKAIMATLLPRLGATREAAMKVLVEAMTEAVSMEQQGDEALKARMKDVDSAFETVAAVLDALPPKSRTGKTVCDVVVEISADGIDRVAA